GYTDALVAHFLTAFTQPHDVVFDPFAGFGTTLVVAEAMQRVAFGMEADAARVGYAQTLLAHPGRMIHGDTRSLLSYSLPAFDFSMTSIPYMTQDDPDNPLAGSTMRGTGYADYLQDLQQIYRDMQRLMKPHARIVIEVANLRNAAGVTPLAWDVARTLSMVLQFDGETVICWDHYGYGYEHSYCLLFSQRPENRSANGIASNT
ncbi:MAG: hypothetical protein JOZ51_24285, partial [Chloroflexi bacterium]|nr:hypothetical protein [Chloroflexota bacterium]